MQAFDKHLPSKLSDHFLLGTKQCAMNVLNIDQGLSLGMVLTLMKYRAQVLKPKFFGFKVQRF
jgi:hypothetical protein